ncbi:MAG: mechanosensitive ion channel domain-containing protein [Acidobacteriota bacterium]
MSNELFYGVGGETGGILIMKYVFNYVSQLIGRFLSYIPNIIAAILIFIIGLTMAKILGGSVAAFAKSAGLEYAAPVGLFVKYFITLVVIIFGLAQLGVQTNILTIIFAVLVISFGLALALSLGLGSRAVVFNILAGAFAREHFPAGKEVEIQGMKGKILAVGSVTTSVETDGREITVPNTLLIENVFD